MMVTADHVARAIIAACRITGADPIAIPQSFFTGIPGIQRPRTVARALAAAALLDAFPEYRKVAIGRFVGSRTPDVYIAKLRADIRQGKPPWQSADHLAAVIAAIKSEGGVEGHARQCGPADTVNASKLDVNRMTDAPLDAKAGNAQVAGIEPGPSEQKPAPDFSASHNSGEREPSVTPARAGAGADIPRWSDKVSRSAPPSKRAMYDMLAEAARNTQEVSS